ncbi:PHP domain-containing protein [bacterium]|nr:PHP domain-containing protein [bacterium]
MENIKEILYKFKENNCEDIEKKLNLHIHTTCSDGSLSPVEAVNFAKENGYAYFSITDHNNFEAYKEIDYKNIDGLITGIEFDCWYKGVFIHLLCYGINPFAPEMQQFLAKSKAETKTDIVRIFAKRDVEKIINTVHSLGGIAVLAHPCCCFCLSLNHFFKIMKEAKLDGIEVFYPYKRHRAIFRFHLSENVFKYAQKYDFLLTAGTDKH